ncbi:MAG: hypothetical protein ABWX90_01235 [Candidatus Saccharimonadales bacterium]
MNEALFPRTPEKDAPVEEVVVHAELAAWAARTMKPALARLNTVSRTQEASQFALECSQASGVSRYILDHHGNTGVLTPELEEQMTWQES